MEAKGKTYRNDVLFVVPRLADAAKLNKQLPKGSMACHVGAALCGARFTTIIRIRADALWGPDVLAWTPQQEQEWWDNAIHTRLTPDGKIL